MTYKEYKTARQIQIRNLVNSKLMHLTDPTMIQTVLDDALSEYDYIVHQNIKELYKKTGLTPELYELERFIPKIKNKKIKQSISAQFFDLNLLFDTINEMTHTDEPKRDHPSLEDCLSKIPPEKRPEATSILQKYINEYQEEPTYIGSGESCTVFTVGNKVIKFGARRRYSNIPYCLHIDEQLEYEPNHFMYVTDRVETGNISEVETEAMYRVLRDQGYVWVDVKPDNIGRLNGKLKILDDVDIYTEEDALTQHHKSTILEFVSYNRNLAFLELKWLKSKNPFFMIHTIDKYFQNQSTQTKEKIDRIKDHYITRTKSYTFDPNIEYYQTFSNILTRKIAEQNNVSENTTSKQTSLQ